MLGNGLVNHVAIERIGVDDIVGDCLLDEILDRSSLHSLEHLFSLLFAGSDMPGKLGQNIHTR